MNLLYPVIPRHCVSRIVGWTLFGACIAGAYGIVHDQITYSIGPEYFTFFKFDQFAWANTGQPARVLVGEIGFLATWWVGAITGWFLSRLIVPVLPPAASRRLMLTAFAIVSAGGLLGGITGALLGWLRTQNPDIGNWASLLGDLHSFDPAGFIRVAYIHNAGYLGAFIGLVVATILLLRARRAFRKNHRAQT